MGKCFGCNKKTKRKIGKHFLTKQDYFMCVECDKDIIKKE